MISLCNARDSDVDRRKFIESTVATAVAAALVRTAVAARFGLGRGVGHAGAFVLPAGPFYQDPYSAYTSVIASQTYTGTQGAVTTVQWNGGTLTAPTYGPDASGTMQPALTAAVGINGGAAVRVCVLAGQAWNFGTSTGCTLPATLSTTATNRFVIQGDPAATPSTMPTITVAGTTAVGANAFWIGGKYLGTAYSNPHVTVRKIRFTGFTNSTGCAAVTAYGDQDSGSGGSNEDLEVCYCQADAFQCSGAQGESGLVYQTGRGGTQTGWVHHCKAFNIQTINGSTDPVNENHAWVGTYGGVWIIEYNEFYGAYNGVRFKGCTSNIPNGNIVRYNYIHDCCIGISFQSGGGAPAPNGIEIYGNLLGWEHYNDAVYYDPTYNSHTILPIAFADVLGDVNTFPQNNIFYNNTISEVWGSGGYYAFDQLESGSTQFYNNLMLGATLCTGASKYQGQISASSLTAGGSGYSDGTYSTVALSGGAGASASASTIVISAGVITSVTLPPLTGQNYAVNDSLSLGTNLQNGVSTLTVAGGSGYTSGTYNNVTLTGGSGTLATATIVVTSGAVTGVTLVNQGQNYAVNDVLTASGLGSGTGFSATVTAVTGAGTGFALTVTAVTESPGFSTLDYNGYWQGNWYRYLGASQELLTTFAEWQSSYTNYPTLPDLTFNPDTHGVYIPNLTAPYNTLGGNFPNYATPGVQQYALSSSSPLATAGESGGAMGYDAATCGPGW